MNEISIKNVPFCESVLLAVQKKENGKIYVAINSVLRELGFDEKQIEYRRDKWKNDKVLSKGTLKFSGTLLGAGTGKDIWCIDVNKLPLALSKLDITPKMEKELPELSDKLEIFQEECADVLSAAFIENRKKSAMELLELEFAAIKEVDEKVEAVNADLQEFKRNLPLLPADADEIKAEVNKVAVKCLGGKESNSYKDRNLCQKVYWDIYRELKRQFEVSQYKYIRQHQKAQAVEVIRHYELPIALKEKVVDYNSQINIAV